MKDHTEIEQESFIGCFVIIAFMLWLSFGGFMCGYNLGKKQVKTVEYQYEMEK